MYIHQIKDVSSENITLSLIVLTLSFEEKFLALINVVYNFFSSFVSFVLYLKYHGYTQGYLGFPLYLPILCLTFRSVMHFSVNFCEG